MNKPYQLFLVSIACLFLLSACGQKGPLFLPDSDSVQETEQEAEQNSEENNEDST
jgi:predicted small lipoprotein YifL